MTNVTRRMRSVKSEESAVECNTSRGWIRTRTVFSGFDSAFFCMGIEFMRRDSPPKPFWRGEMSKGNAR